MTSDRVRAMRVGLQSIPHLKKAHEILDVFECDFSFDDGCKSCPFFPVGIPNLDVCICLAVLKTMEHIKKLEFDVKQKRLIDDE